MNEVILEDGTILREKGMGQFVKQLPTLKQWSLWLALTRPDYGIVIMNRITAFVCLFCGDLFEGYPTATRTKMPQFAHLDGTDRITVSALVRMREETVTTEAGTKVIETGFTAKPVAHRGLGCPACLALFKQEQQRVRGQHITAEQLDTINARLAELQGCANCSQPYTYCSCGVDAKGKSKFKMRTFATTRKDEARLRLWETIECGECKDTFHKWDKENGRYLVCSCYQPNPFFGPGKQKEMAV